MRSTPLLVLVILMHNGIIAQHKKNRLLSKNLDVAASVVQEYDDIESEPLEIDNEPEAAKASGALSTATFNTERKKKEVIALVEEGIQYLTKHKLNDVFHAFTHTKKFIKGELYLYVFEPQGVCLAHGEEENLVWSNLYNLQDDYGSFIVQDILAKARDGGGWLTYRWRNATKNSYVKQVRVGEKTYVVGSGYYPHSEEDSVVSLVKGAIALFNTTIKQGRPKEEALSPLSYTLGRFVLGDLYLYAFNAAGMLLADGDLPGRVGVNILGYQDTQGKYVYQEIIAKLKELDAGTGIWINYTEKNAMKRTYAEKALGNQGEEYFIACGYFPETTGKKAAELVRRGYQYMKKNGKTQAAQLFNNQANNEFRYGDLYLIVYDMKGVVIANGNNPQLVGQNFYNEKDEYGTYYVQELIKKAEQGGGSTEFKIRNSFQSFYVEKIDLGVEEYVIGSGIFPSSKEDTMILMAKGGAEYLKSNTYEDAFKEFVKKNGKFIRGDLSVFVVDAQGICYAHGDDYDLIWRNLMNLKDDAGKSYIQLFINTARRGAGQVTYTLDGKKRRVHVEPVQKEGTLYIVGSEYCE